MDSLDVALLQERLFQPALGIDDPRSDPRLHYVSAAFSMSDLERNCRERGEIAFAVYPTSIADLMAVADAGE